AVQRGHARRDVFAAGRVRSRAPRESRQGRARAQLPRVAGAARASRRTCAGSAGVSLARTALHPHSADDLAEIVRNAHGGLRIRGAGTWMHVGAPVQATHELRLDAFSGVREYRPDDLTI